MVGFSETGDALKAALYGTVSASYAVESFGALKLLEIDRNAAQQIRTCVVCPAQADNPLA